MIALCWCFQCRAHEKSSERSLRLCESDCAECIRRRAPRCNCQQCIVGSDRVRCEFRSDAVVLIFAAFAALSKSHIAASNQTNHLTWITAECRRAFTCIKHAKTTRCPGATVKQSAASANARNESVNESNDRGCCVRNCGMNNRMIVGHRSHLFERCQQVKIFGTCVALFCRDMTAIRGERRIVCIFHGIWLLPSGVAFNSRTKKDHRALSSD